MRIWRLNKYGISVSVSARGVLYERICGFFGLIALIVTGIPTLLGVIHNRHVQYVTVTLIELAVLECMVLLSI